MEHAAFHARVDRVDGSLHERLQALLTSCQSNQTKTHTHSLLRWQHNGSTTAAASYCWMPSSCYQRSVRLPAAVKALASVTRCHLRENSGWSWLHRMVFAELGDDALYLLVKHRRQPAGYGMMQA